jgi:hypothetical protein
MRRLALLPLLIAAGLGHGAEGMWTLDRLPLEALQREHGFAPDAAWIERTMKASVRLAGGCSGSFVSPDGLVMTNHHCIVDCLSGLSSADENLSQDGFLARERSDERQCPAMELNRLESIVDVSERIANATAGKSGEAYAAAKRAEQAKIAAECVGSDSATVRCDVVDLYQGGLQHLYRYRRFADARLVFAPEFDAGFFGGDPDNFEYPRYNLDFALLRAYEDGKPVTTPEHFRFRPEGAEAGELVMVTGHPGSTQRGLTVAQLETLRQGALMRRLLYLAEIRGLLQQYGAEDAERARWAQDDLFSVENSLKALRGRLQALLDPSVFEAKRAEEAELRDFAKAEPARSKAVGDPWAEVEEAENVWRRIEARHAMIEGGQGFQSSLFTQARRLLRGAEERSKPDGERLREFSEAGLPRLAQQVASTAPIHPEFESVKLAWSLTKLREALGADDPFVRRVLGNQSPRSVAERAVSGSRLADPEVRRALWEGGAKALADFQDPMIDLARLVDPEARTLRKQVENEVQAVQNRAAERIARLRFERHGTAVYPDATFSLRLSYGRIEGWEENGRRIAPFTDMAGLYARATGAPPYALPARWLDRKDALDLSTRMNQVSSNDIIGGNSGSPLIDAQGRIVGLIFDGNIHSLGGAYWYDARLNRAVSVHSAAMLHALEKVYEAGWLARELRGE